MPLGKVLFMLISCVNIYFFKVTCLHAVVGIPARRHGMAGIIIPLGAENLNGHFISTT
jgi:hypothetical protein